MSELPKSENAVSTHASPVNAASKISAQRDVERPSKHGHPAQSTTLLAPPEQNLDVLVAAIGEVMVSDAPKLKSLCDVIRQRTARGLPVDRGVRQAAQLIKKSKARVLERQKLVPSVQFPETLPISARRDDIAKTIAENPVVILAGETGSGKTTQIPKLCLSLGLGVKGLIGHTQPRRIAARTVASRIAEELQTPLGQSVGYQVRFTDHSQANSHIKLMTDGILLAEIQNDPLLLKYEVIIVDEAHERSLNIDFLLGYLKRLLKKRDDLKIIVTSATIDLERFSEHFDKAPIIEVSGRTFPVTVHYRPWADNFDDITEAIVETVADILTLPAKRNGSGNDILIFLSGEREIRETSHALKKAGFDRLHILPLYARLSLAEQNKIFHPSGGGRRVILATNVAETSITVPGIRYVIDPGTARISRYSLRTKVQRLPIETISQASANQRMGRCGRVAEGECFRLYDKADFESRAAFTDAEILRTNLAAVVLQMLQLRIGAVEDFPFVDKPDQRLINDAYKLLEELKAVDARGKVTSVGRQLYSVPLDPKLARMLLESVKHDCINEMLIIVSGLSLQDPRERPVDKQQQADEKHRRFADDQSDFLAYVNLWNYIEEQRQELTQNQLRKLCKKEFLNYLRLKEWRDLHHQIKLAIKNWQVKINHQPAGYTAIHKALLAGLLSNVALKSDEQGSREYFGTRNRKCMIFPGSAQGKKRPKWLVAAEFIETSQLFAHCVAKVDPEWVLEISNHLVKKNYFEPHYDVRSGQVKAYVKITLFGLVLVEKQRVNYNKIDDKQAREVFIRAALVEGRYRGKGSFFKFNQQLIADIEDLEAKSRRTDILVDDQMLFEFYDSVVPANITNLAGFEHWRKSSGADDHSGETPLLFMSKEQLMLHQANNITDAQFPSTLTFDGMVFPVSYVFEPGKTNDGVNLHVPVELLHVLPENYLHWLVPGLLRDKCIALLKSLPKTLRKQLVPVPNFVDKVLPRLRACNRPLTEVLAEALYRVSRIEIGSEFWDLTDLEPFYQMNILVVDDKGKVIASDRSLALLRKNYRQTVQKTLQSASHDWERNGLKSWTFGELKDSVQLKKGAVKVKAFPALVDSCDGADLKVLDNPYEAQMQTRRGVARLALLAMSHTVKYLQKDLLRGKDIGLSVVNLGRREQVVDDILMAACAQLVCSSNGYPVTAQAFEQVVSEAKGQLTELARWYEQELLTCLASVVAIRKSLKSHKNALVMAFTFSDITAQLNALFYAGFLFEVPKAWFGEYRRYLKAVELRIDKAPQHIQKDRVAISHIDDFWQRHLARIEKDGKAQYMHNNAWQDYRWMLEEWRVSLFAQSLKTKIPVSDKRLKKQWEASLNQ